MAGWLVDQAEKHGKRDFEQLLLLDKRSQQFDWVVYNLASQLEAWLGLVWPVPNGSWQYLEPYAFILNAGGGVPFLKQDFASQKQDFFPEIVPSCKQGSLHEKQDVTV